MKSNFNVLIKIKNLLGILLIILGLVCNEWIFEKFASIYAVMEFNKRFPMWLLEVCLISAGIVLLLTVINKDSIKSFFKFYKTSAIVIFNTFLLFIFVNFLIFSYFIVKDVFLYKNQIFLKYGISPDKLYPYLQKQEINQLLRETWSRPCIYEPYTQFKERPYKGTFVNVSENGFRVHEDYGPWPPNPKNFNIFLFGGSTVFNYGVPDNYTIAFFLQKYFFKDKSGSKKVYIYNFGRGYYFSSQERILFEKLLVAGFVPDAAVFLDGLNDFFYIDGEPLFTDRLRDILENGGSVLTNIPIIRAIKEIKTNKNKSLISRLQKPEEEYKNPEVIESVINRYFKNKKIIEAVADAYSVKSVFVWQPVPTYEYDLKYHDFASGGFGGFTYSKYGYQKMAEIVKSKKSENNFLWLADIQKDATKPLYVDIDHYSAEFSEVLAKKIHDFLLEKNIVK